LSTSRVKLTKGRNFIVIVQTLRLLKVQYEQIYMVNHRAAEIGFKNVSDANFFLRAAEQNKEAGLETSIDRREISVRGVITDWPDSVSKFWEAVRDRENILRIERMIAKKWNNVEKTYSYYDTGNMIITFKGNKLPERLWLWEHVVALSIRPHIPAVRQCFRFGHIKAFCKSEERCLICGELSHGRCERPKKCRNCEGEHNSTDKRCSRYEWNKNIVTIMSHNNVSHREAVLILKGKEDSQKTNNYNRYAEPKQWPSLPKSRGENKNLHNRDSDEDRRNKETYGRVADIRPNMRNSTPTLVNREFHKRIREIDNQKVSDRERKTKTNEKEKIRNFYESFDPREGEIRKKDWGIALRNVSVESLHRTDAPSQRTFVSDEEFYLGNSIQRTEITPRLFNDIDQTIEICADLVQFMQKDADLRKWFLTMLEGHSRTDSDTSELEDKEEEELVMKTGRRKREEDTEEEKIRQRQLIERIKTRYNGRQSAEFSSN